MRKPFYIILSGLFLLSGCTVSSFLKSDQPVTLIYALRAAEDLTPVDMSRKTISRVMEVQRPILPPGFDTARITMYLDGGHRLDYFAASQWTAPLDEAMQEFTSQTVRKTLPNIIVADPGQTTGVEYRLQMRVNDFEPVYANGPEQAPRLNANITFTLLKMPEEKIVTNFTIDQQEAARANNLGAITSGLENILQSVEAKALMSVAPYLK